MDRISPIETYGANVIAEGKILVELKAVISPDDSHLALTLNYLKVNKPEIGLLIILEAKD